MNAAGLPETLPIPENLPGPFRLVATTSNQSAAASFSRPIGLFGLAQASTKAGQSWFSGVVFPALSEEPKPGELPAGVWRIFRGNGFLAFSLTATIGYNLNFVRNSKFRLLQSRVAAAFETLLGCRIDDAYAVVLNRQAQGNSVRLQLFRANQQSEHLGVDLSVGIAPHAPAPPTDFLAFPALRPQVAAQVAAAIPRLMRSNLAAAYERTTQLTALIDASFDLDQEPARSLFDRLAAGASLDPLFLEDIPGVTLRRGLLTHDLTRSLQIQVHLPFFDRQPRKINQTLASLQVEEDAGRVLLYTLASGDKILSDRFRTELAVLGQLTVKNDKLDLTSLDHAQIAYRTRATDGPLLNEQDIRLPGSLLAAWFQPRNKQQAGEAARLVSIALQTELRLLVPQLYFEDRYRLRPNAPAAALLVWASFPPAPDVYWDWRSPDVRANLLRDPRTFADLTRSLAQWHAVDGPASTFLQLAAQGQGSELLQSLLFTESQLVWSAKKAIDKLRNLASDAANAPTKALAALTAFGEQITSTFHRGLTIYCHAPATRSLNSQLFAEASRALAGDSEDVTPEITVTTFRLRPDATFGADDFLNGADPPPEQIESTRVTTNFSALPPSGDT